jgi:hypothetical protein
MIMIPPKVFINEWYTFKVNEKGETPPFSDWAHHKVEMITLEKLAHDKLLELLDKCEAAFESLKEQRGDLADDMLTELKARKQNEKAKSET